MFFNRKLAAGAMTGEAHLTRSKDAPEGAGWFERDLALVGTGFTPAGEPDVRLQRRVLSPRREVSAMRALLVVVAALAVAVPSASANVRLEGIELPAYARIAGPAVDGGVEEVFHDDEWAAIPFYRPPACVRPGFDLLLFFDIPVSFGCGPLTVEMWTIWRNGPGIDNAPIQVRAEGLGAVPVWFVRWAELQAAMGDGALTIVELAALPSLLAGSASFYSETIHPTQAANVPFLQFVARGNLEDGRRFQAEATRSGGAGRLTHVGIRFR